MWSDVALLLRSDRLQLEVPVAHEGHVTIGRWHRDEQEALITGEHVVLSVPAVLVEEPLEQGRAREDPGSSVRRSLSILAKNDPSPIFQVAGTRSDRSR